MKNTMTGITLIIAIMLMLLSTIAYTKVMYLNDYSDRNFVDLNKVKCQRKSNTNILALKSHIRDISKDKINFVKLANDLDYVNILANTEGFDSIKDVDFEKIVTSIINAEVITNTESIAKNNGKAAYRKFTPTISGSKLGLTVYDLGGFFKFNIEYDIDNGMNLGNGQSVDSRVSVPGYIITTPSSIIIPGGGDLQDSYASN